MYKPRIFSLLLLGAGLTVSVVGCMDKTDSSREGVSSIKPEPSPSNQGSLREKSPTNNLKEGEVKSFQANIVCEAWQGYPSTILKDPQQEDIVLIRWRSEYFSGSGFTPKRRCDIVSEKLQQVFSEEKSLYLAMGRVNGLPVICFSNQLNTECDEILLTMERGDDPKLTLKYVTEKLRYLTNDPIVK